ncbi:NAD(P)/FAD-dependent oxidoreductase [Rhodococcus erythropolis]|uniref:NAD(P)/FAD-dependent oxidoreductase n=1 Tax=Rhodococcus erythropolis TaxID=1833 RepID=UPI001BEB61FC|nr:FAD-dependent oxidoreductase [Rhodococcus erythropolis]MBT2266084.1 FAD-dependent oxidoreductase [Rhodococcus erythropolis]
MNAVFVVLGGGQAGVQAADSLRALDPHSLITVIDDELHHPYQRPPLSKALWTGDIAKAALPLRSTEFFRERGIRLLSGARACRIHRDARTVELSDGTVVPYDALVIATGARARLIRLPGADLPGVHQLRTLTDGLALQEELRTAKSITTIGAGFIGLEVAASALQHGIESTVFEMQDRILGRAVTPQMSEWLARKHRSDGMDLRLSTPLERIEAGNDGRVSAVITAKGERIQTEVVVAGVGALPNSELAEDAGLHVDDGIVVDEHLRTKDVAIWAVGDCVRFPSHFTGSPSRLESIQNATDQGKTAAKNIVAVLRGESPEQYVAVPWFWSNQGRERLQIAGVGGSGADSVVVREYGDGKFSVFVYESEKLTVVESVNAPADHIAARRILATGGHLDPVLAADPAFPLKTVLEPTA